MKRTRKRSSAPDPALTFGYALRKFLLTKGWNVIVAGNSRIEHDPFAPKHKYRFVIDFSGFPPKEQPDGDKAASD